MTLELFELWVEGIGAAAGFTTLAVALWGFRRAQRRPGGREAGIASRFLRWPILFSATLVYLGLGALLWRPIPLALSPSVRLITLLGGALLLFPALALYLWGLRALG